jgi:hypothetical protein
MVPHPVSLHPMPSKFIRLFLTVRESDLKACLTLC